jgi:hypothetical protein
MDDDMSVSATSINTLDDYSPKQTTPNELGELSLSIAMAADVK